MDPEYTKCDCADRCTYPQIILKLVHSNFGGIQTHDLCLVVRLVQQREQFIRCRIQSDALNLLGDSWHKLIGCQRSRYIRFSTAQQRWSFDSINVLFLRSILFRSERFSCVMAVLISHQQRSVTCKYQNVCHSRSCVQHAGGLFVT